jgi:iron complex outermembrane receptor protein
MKNLYIVLFIIISNTIWASNNTLSKTLSGKINDKETGEPITGAYIYLPDLKTGAISDNKGNYKIENLPQVKVLVQVSFVGYKNIFEQVDLTTTTNKDFALEHSITEMNEIVVTGASKAAELKRTPTPISVVPKSILLQNSSTNIIDAIASQPGISQVTTGTGISKPVIRGLGYNRVLVVNDGIRQEGQQWGDEHGIEIDEYAINKVEILKGPASLAYGSDAMAGVINMISDPALPDGKIAGNFSSNYQTNNGMIGYSANLAGNLKGLIWDVRYSNKLAHAYQNKYDGYVFNSGYRENAISGLIGLNKSWGYSHLLLSAYNLMPGIIEGERDSVTGKFIKPIAVNNATEGSEIASEKDFQSYRPFTPFQKIHHYKAVLNNNFIVGDGSLKATLGFQQNQRQEYADILKSNQYGLYFLLNTFNYDVLYNFPEKNDLDISVGFNGMHQTSKNKGEEFLIPEYNLFDIGIFTIVKKSFGKLDIIGGLRYDTRIEHGDDLFLDAEGMRIETSVPGSIQRFAEFNSTFSGLSGSIGATYQISKIVFTKLNISRGFRAPNIAELSSNGVHEGTIRYELGDSKLKAETSWQFDYTFGFNTEHIAAEMNIFDNHIGNFIFSRKLSSFSGGDSISYGVSSFKFVSGNANLFGGEARIDIHPHPLDWLHFENAFSYVQAIQNRQPDSAKYLPLTPAPKLQTTLKADIRKLGHILQNAYIKFEVENYFTQNKYYAAYSTETKTPGYTLLNFGAGSDVILKRKTLCSLYISVNNLADIAYQSHLSRLKYTAVNYAIGRTGIYNMGRNVSFKLLVPIGFKK